MRGTWLFSLSAVVAVGCSSGGSASNNGTGRDAATSDDAGDGAPGMPGVDGSAGGNDAGHDASAAIDSGSHPGSDASAEGGATTWWKPPVNTTFYWDLASAPPDNGKNVGAYDIDGWNNTASEVATLHGMGRMVVCYMDAGTYEPNRPDSASFPASLKGSAVSGWPGEFWLDVRPSGPNYATLQSIMLARFQACRQKGFDAVEPDNIDSYANSPGFPTTAADQLAYDEWISTTVHSLGMAVLQKNDLDQIATLLPYFDGLLDEECNKYSECNLVAPYVTAGKPVWNAEYTEDGETTAMFCAADVSAGIVGALFSIKLDGSLFQPCSDDVGNIH